MKVKSKERKWKRKVKRLSCFSFVLVKGSMHEDIDVSLAVVHGVNSCTPASSAWSIFDGDIVVLGPLVTVCSPFRVVGDLWRSNLHAVRMTVVFGDNMSLIVALTTPKVSDIVIGSSADLHTMPLFAMGISIGATSTMDVVPLNSV